MLEQTPIKIPRKFIKDLRSFIDNSSHLITSDVGAETIKDRITRLYTRLNNPITPKDQLHSIYRLLAAYAVLGAMREQLGSDRAEQ